MPHNLDLIHTLTGGMTAALVFGYFTQRAHLSPIVGYLLAGVAVGPFTPGFVAKAEIAEQFAELGVILLMFGVGLHFHLKELLAVARIAVPGALVQIAFATLLGVWVAQAAGWSGAAGLVFGVAISVASTVVLLRVLADHDALHTQPGHISIGWLLVEDLFTVLVLVLLPTLVGPSAATDLGSIARALGLAVLKVSLLVAVMLSVGKRAVPMLLGFVGRTRSRELFTLTVLVLALGLAVGAASLFGASMALGAFLAGMIVGQSDFSARAASEALPMRDAFAVLFFVSMGMLFDPSQFVANLPLTAATLAVILIGKPLIAWAVLRVRGYPVATALPVAFALAQVGEFSFIVAALGRSLGVLPATATQALVTAAIVSITLNPYLFRLARPLARRWHGSDAPHTTARTSQPPPLAASPRAIVIGYGPVGRTLVELLQENAVEPLVIELNHETVAALGRAGIRALYGDAASPEVLEQAGIRSAVSLIFTASGPPEPAIAAARELRPDLLILTRATYVREVQSLKQAGARIVVSAEGEVALAMTEHLLLELGASHEQLDHARDRVHGQLGLEPRA